MYLLMYSQRCSQRTTQEETDTGAEASTEEPTEVVGKDTHSDVQEQHTQTVVEDSRVAYEEIARHVPIPVPRRSTRERHPPKRFQIIR